IQQFNSWHFLAHQVSLSSRILLMPGHGSNRVIQHTEAYVRLGMNGINHTVHSGVEERGVSQDTEDFSGILLSFQCLSQSDRSGESGTHTDRDIESVQRRIDTQSI